MMLRGIVSILENCLGLRTGGQGKLGRLETSCIRTVVIQDVAWRAKTEQEGKGKAEALYTQL